MTYSPTVYANPVPTTIIPGRPNSISEKDSVV